MNLHEQLMAEMSRLNIDYIANYVGNDPERFDELMQLIFTETGKIPLRATWAVTVISDKYPEMIRPYTDEIISKIDTFQHTGIHRMLLKCLLHSPLTENHEGEIYDICYRWLLSRNEPPAVKALSMLMLYRIAKKEPDLLRELLLIIEDMSDDESAAIRSVCRQIKKAERR